MNAQEVDIQRMVKETRIPIGLIKEALRIPLTEHPAATLEQAKEAYHRAPRGSEEKEAALAK